MIPITKAPLSFSFSRAVPGDPEAQLQQRGPSRGGAAHELRRPAGAKGQ